MIIFPNAASTYTADACIPGGSNRLVWVGFVANSGASGGSMIWFKDASPTAGSVLIPIVIASALQPVQFGPFMSANGLYAASITTGSAFLWLKSVS